MIKTAISVGCLLGGIMLGAGASMPDARKAPTRFVVTNSDNVIVRIKGVRWDMTGISLNECNDRGGRFNNGTCEKIDY
jgi:hypothetical protein